MKRYGLTIRLSGILSICTLMGTEAVKAAPPAPDRIVDLSLLVAMDYPCTWSAGFPPFQINHDRSIGPLSPFHREILTIDENTGTQFDAPAHSIPPLGSPYPDAGPMGQITGDKAPFLAVRR